jgi:hypothetical protein
MADAGLPGQDLAPVLNCRDAVDGSANIGRHMARGAAWMVAVVDEALDDADDQLVAVLLQLGQNLLARRAHRHDHVVG